MTRSPFPPDYPGDYPKIVTPLPGPKAKELIARDARTVSQNLSKDVPLVVARGQGMVVEDVDGNRFLDFAAGISTVSTGHCHPEVVKAVQEQAGRLMHVCYTDFFYPVYVELCEELSAIAPMSGSKRVFLTNALKCKPAGRGSAEPRELSNCREHLLRIRRHSLSVPAIEARYLLAGARKLGRHRRSVSARCGRRDREADSRLAEERAATTVRREGRRARP